jgi:hypothetical protein
MSTAAPIVPTSAPPRLGAVGEAPALVDRPEGDQPRFLSRFWLCSGAPSWLISAVVHFLVIVTLALIAIEPRATTSFVAIGSSQGEGPDKLEDLSDEKFEFETDELAIAAPQGDVAQQALEDLVATTGVTTAVPTTAATAPAVELSDFAGDTAPKGDLLATVGAFSGMGIGSREAGERGKMVAALGGSGASEAAVEAALKWLAAHQQADGSWNFDHQRGPCQAQCGDPGFLIECSTGATALALLPFLGAGYTHTEGPYKETVDKGLYFLVKQMRISEVKRPEMEIGDLGQGGRQAYMYAHGLASIVLCEAYAMTQDRSLMRPAQLALNHIAHTQDPVGGGWRYFPTPMPGDTSVVGWQLMALKSGHMAYLDVDAKTIKAATRFLNSVQAQGGAYYGYKGPGMGEGTTAIGLLCRMYLGWKRDNPALQRGVVYLDRLGPAIDPLGESGNLYYNYYATQVMRHYCGDPDSEGHEMWVRWNKKMRDWLIKAQALDGHQKGSWYIRLDPGSNHGGRLYSTAMATMILEVYYRHMPIYTKEAAADNFPLD